MSNGGNQSIYPSTMVIKRLEQLGDQLMAFRAETLSAIGDLKVDIAALKVRADGVEGRIESISRDQETTQAMLTRQRYEMMKRYTDLAVKIAWLFALLSAGAHYSGLKLPW